MCILCFLIPLLVGVVCAWLGYLLGKMVSRSTTDTEKLRSELEICMKEKEQLLAWKSGAGGETAEWKNKYHTLLGELEAVRSQTAGLPPAVPFDAALAASVFGTTIRQDDLKIVEGIGPVIAEIFRNQGITTWKALAETPVADCRRILDEAGERFRLHNPETWPRQAGLAYLGKWEELKAWQEALQGGRN